MTARPGRGRPPVFDEPFRDKYLAAIADGMTLTEAAEHLGIHRNTPTHARRTNRAFAAALDDARARGKKARDDKKPHDEYRYNMLGCRCPKCRAAHTQARRGRRQAEPDQPDADLINLPTHPTSRAEDVVPAPLLLVRAS